MKKSAFNSTQNSTLTRTATASVVTRLSADRRLRNKTNRTGQAAEAPDLTVDMVELRTAIEDSPTINASKIVDIHSRISAGTYKIDAQRLTEKLVELESSLD